MRSSLSVLEWMRGFNDGIAKAVDSLADGQSVLAPGLPTFNQYVHNRYSFPKPSELYLAWDELAPFMEKLWP